MGIHRVKTAILLLSFASLLGSLAAGVAADTPQRGTGNSTLNVVPSTGLGTAQVVTVIGAGFAPNVNGALKQCFQGRGLPLPNEPGCGPLLFITTDGSGGFTVPMTVTAFLPEPFPTNPQSPAQMFCASICNVLAFVTPDAAGHPLSFLPGPSLTTSASGPVTVGSPITDTVTLTGGRDPTGTITFRVYGPDDPNCTDATVFTSVVTVSGNGTYTSAPFTPNHAGSYNWVVTYSGDANNASVTSSCGAANETSMVLRARPAIETQATTNRPVPEPLLDTATLSGGFEPTGIITFQLYAPDDPNCTGIAVFTSTVTVSGNGTYTSAPFVPTRAGPYHWVVAYSGDANNESVTSSCGAENETSAAMPVRPVLVTVATTDVQLGQPVTDTAVLLNGFSATGTLTFRLYGPGDPNCTGTPVFTSTVTVSGDGSYASGSFAPNVAGSYHWVVTYSGDVNNTPVTSSCGAAFETSVVLASPTIETTAESGLAVGLSVIDTATLLGGLNPTGTLTFQVFGPDDSNCTGTPVFTSTVTVNGNGSYRSASFTPTRVGSYNWVVTYSGDANNAAKVSRCGEAGETSLVRQRDTFITTEAAPRGTVGRPVTDSATLRNGFNPTGELVFFVYGPNDPNCTGAFRRLGPFDVEGNGVYSASFTPTAPGTYHWAVSYLGDLNNAPFRSPCPLEHETTVVVAAPTLTTKAVPEANLGDSITDTATLADGVQPGGVIIFRLYGPNNPNCRGRPIFVSPPVPVNGNGVYPSPSFRPPAAGTYNWTAEYMGDGNNAPATSGCGAPNETTVVRPPPVAQPALSTMATPTAAVGQPIVDVAFLSGGIAPTGSIVFQLYGPDDPTCSGPVVATSIAAVGGNGSYTSGPFTPTAPGRYNWIASYSGDGGNTPATSPCGSANEVTVVVQIVTQASPTAVVGRPMVDTATLSGAVSPSGSISFALFDNPTCEAPAVFSSTVPVQGNGNYLSGPFTPTAPGRYNWTASYSGDSRNAPATSPCGAPSETTIVSLPACVTVTGDVPGAVVVNLGEHVCLREATVIGAVTVNRGGALTVERSRIPQVVANGAAGVRICDTDVAPPRRVTEQAVVVTGSGGGVLIGDPAQGCGPNRVAGSVTLRSNRAGQVFGANTISLNVSVDFNVGGPMVIKANQILGTLRCVRNYPPPTNAGQPNTAASKTGQCSNL